MPPGRPKTGKKLRIFPVFAAFAKVSRKRGLWLIAHEKADMPATDISAKITLEKDLGFISLRWHYPNQVTGLGNTSHSQPTDCQLPFSSSLLL